MWDGLPEWGRRLALEAARSLRTLRVRARARAIGRVGGENKGRVGRTQVGEGFVRMRRVWGKEKVGP